MSEPSIDVIVVGGGVIGAWSAHYLLRQGCRVRLIERDTMGSGASGGNCGYVCPSHVLPLCGPGAVRDGLMQILHRSGALSIAPRIDPTLWRWLVQFALNCTPAKQSAAAEARHQLLQSSWQLYKDYISESNVDCQWQDRGLMLVHRHQRELDRYEPIAERLKQEFGLDPQRVTGDELASNEPSLTEGLAGAWFFPGDSHLNPMSLLAGLRQSILSQSGQILESTDVVQIQSSSNRIEGLQTSAGFLSADRYVFCLGAESPQFAKALGCRLPIVPGKGLSMTFGRGVSMPNTPMIFEDCHVALTPLNGEYRIGSTMQFIGYDRRVDPRRLKMIRDKAQSYLKDRLPESPAAIWAGWRPMVPDDLPCIGPAPGAANATIAAGNGMIGISTGSATGKLVADMVCQQTPQLDPLPFSPARF